MADPKSWDLLAAFEACLAQITVAGGYHTDAGAYVTREPHQIPESQGALVAIVLDGLSRATDTALLRTHRQASVLVVGKVSTDQDNAQQRLHQLIADIEQCFEQRHPAFAVGLQFPVFVEAKPIPPAEGMKWIGAQVRFSSHIPRR